MFICLCKGVTDTQIREAVEQGADSLQSIRQTLGLGTQCCKCIPEARHIIQQTLSNTGYSSNSVQLFIPQLIPQLTPQQANTPCTQTIHATK